MTVYRGQKKTSRTIKNANWYSCSSSKEAAKVFAEGDCCLFEIHLINVPIIDVNKIVGKYLEELYNITHEDEIIVVGGGTFYKDSELTQKGFPESQNSEGVFECWYKMDE